MKTMKRAAALLLVLCLAVLPAAALGEENGKLEFSTVNLDGEPVTEGILTGKRIVMINVWTTWCGYCLREMPQLAQLEKVLPEEACILYLCADLPDLNDEWQRSQVEEIVQNSGINRKNVLVCPAEEFLELLEGLTGYPTTYYADGKGYLASEATVGAYFEGYVNFLENVLGPLPSIE